MSNIGGYYPAPVTPVRQPLPPPIVVPPQAPTNGFNAPSGQGVSVASLPGGRMFANFNGGDWISTGGNLAHIYNMAKTGLTGGRGVNSAFGELWHAIKGLHGNGLFAGIKGVIGGAIPFATNSALFEGAVSAIVNGYYLVTGREGMGTFGGNVVGDTMTGFAGGAGAAVGGAIVMAVLPFGGTLGLILTALGGVLGYGMAANMLRSTNIYNRITSTVRSALGGR